MQKFAMALLMRPAPLIDVQRNSGAVPAGVSRRPPHLSTLFPSVDCSSSASIIAACTVAYATASPMLQRPSSLVVPAMSIVCSFSEPNSSFFARQSREPNSEGSSDSDSKLSTRGRCLLFRYSVHPPHMVHNSH